MFGFGKKKAKQVKSEPAAAAPEVAEGAGASAPVADGQPGKGSPDQRRPLVGLFKRSVRDERQPAVEPTARPEPAPPASAAKEVPALDVREIPPRSAPEEVAAAVAEPEDEPRPKGSRFAGLKQRLARTREILNTDVADLIKTRKDIDDDLLEELETLLLTADVGVPATTRVIDALHYRVKKREVKDPKALLKVLAAELRDLLADSMGPVAQPAAGRPQVILMVGVNGVGKTTTIGKLAKQLQEEGNSVMLAAGDTFRAAAVEQLQVWGERNGVPVIAQHANADSASVIFDALQAATARGVDVLIADTAGRLHTKSNLMEELKKIARVMKKIDPDAPHEVMLVVDATTGQNALHQAVQFHQAIPLTGITLTKLDGTAKGGILFAIADQLKVPIRFIGVGEQIEDLRHFDADEFVNALLAS
jgi:fused signal recognition particle receptor